MGYVTLDIKITPSTTESNSYKVDASIMGIPIPRRERTASEELSTNSEDWTDLEDALESLKASTHGITEEILAKEFGKSLFQQVIKGKVYTLYKSAKDYCNDRGHILRLRLHLELPELVELPWEFLYEEGGFLGLAKNNPRILIMRSPIDVRPVRTVEHHLPLQILIMTAEPTGRSSDAKREKELIKEALKEVEEEGRVSLKELLGTDAELANIYKNKTLDIFHFIGRGSINEATREGELILEDVHGNARNISADKFSRSLPNSVKLVFLNACEAARGNAHEPFSSIAHILAKQGYVVIAMQFPVSINAASRFADIFYSEMAMRTPVGEAVAEARQRVFTMADCNPLDWAAPVVYMKSEDGVLFNIKDPSPSLSTVRPDEDDVETAADNAATHCKTGNDLFANKSYQEALESYEQAIRLDPKYIDAYNGKGNALSALNRKKEAQKAYQQAARLSIKGSGRL
jgi:tetratricopeptide (TPR) repeat protein